MQAANETLELNRIGTNLVAEQNTIKSEASTSALGSTTLQSVQTPESEGQKENAESESSTLVQTSPTRSLQKDS